MVVRAGRVPRPSAGATVDDDRNTTRIVAALGMGGEMQLTNQLSSARVL